MLIVCLLTVLAGEVFPVLRQMSLVSSQTSGRSCRRLSWLPIWPLNSGHPNDLALPEQALSESMWGLLFGLWQNGRSREGLIAAASNVPSTIISHWVGSAQDLPQRCAGRFDDGCPVVLIRSTD